jgi:hypothetical protein
MAVVGAVTGAVLSLAPGCALAVDRSHPSVVLLGDSLAQEAAPYLEDQLGAGSVVERVFGGTAPCDWLGRDLQATTGRIVVVSFTGNSLTPCMADAHGGHLRAQALVDRYRRDLGTLVGRIRDTGARVLLVQQPERGPDRTAGGSADPDAEVEIAGINAVYADLASAPGVSLVDAGAAVEDPDGAFAASLPCLPQERSCGPDGRNAVRSDDGVHLCAGKAAVPCPTYSSGAFRFARAIAKALDSP